MQLDLYITVPIVLGSILMVVNIIRFFCLSRIRTTFFQQEAFATASGKRLQAFCWSFSCSATSFVPL